MKNQTFTTNTNLSLVWPNDNQQPGSTDHSTLLLQALATEIIKSTPITIYSYAHNYHFPNRPNTTEAVYIVLKHSTHQQDLILEEDILSFESDPRTVALSDPQCIEKARSIIIEVFRENHNTTINALTQQIRHTQECIAELISSTKETRTYEK